MKTWNQLFVCTGWLLEEKAKNVFSCGKETAGNMEFLLDNLTKAGVNHSFQGEMLFIESDPVNEQEWFKIIDFQYRGKGEGFWFEPGKEELKVRELDTYIAGIVRQLNRLGYHTMMSCDGHEVRGAHVVMTKSCEIESLVQTILGLGIKRVYYSERRNGYKVFLPLSRKELLDLAERLGQIDAKWIGQGYEFIKEKLFYQSLEQLLEIPGESGNESEVRSFVKERMTPFVDSITVDRNGNLLAEKTYRGGNGPTILLNAHLDTVYEIEQGRVIEKNDEIWSSSIGILGADDRAGVAIILHIAEHLLNVSNFSGKVKYIFTVKEECGLIGARQVDNYFLWGVDAAIVFDRRGSGDIVTSCGGYNPFCDKEYGEFFERVAEESGLNGWHCTPGGSSDTRIWAEQGIQSVNLSVGYGNEHTEEEYLNVNTCYNVTVLLNEVFGRGKEMQRVLNKIKRNTTWNNLKNRA